MKMNEVRAIAKRWNVNVRVGRSKRDIIREIQVAEGFTPCFGTRTICDQYHCLWRKDCIGDE
jgi:hypothetical protein